MPMDELGDVPLENQIRTRFPSRGSKELYLTTTLI